MPNQFPPKHANPEISQFGCFNMTRLARREHVVLSFDKDRGAKAPKPYSEILHDAPANRGNQDLSSIGPGLHELAEAIKTVPGEVRAEINSQRLAYQRGFLDGTLSAGVVVGVLLAAAFLMRGRPSAFGDRRI